MKIEPEIRFHECSRSQWIEDYINERLQKLDRYADGDITSASVTISGDQLSKHKGNLYSVKAEVHLPPNHVLVATKEREIRDLQNELRPLIKQTFEALDRQLQEAVEKRRYDVKAHIARPEVKLPEEEPPPPG